MGLGYLWTCQKIKANEEDQQMVEKDREVAFIVRSKVIRNSNVHNYLIIVEVVEIRVVKKVDMIEMVVIIALQEETKNPQTDTVQTQAHLEKRNLTTNRDVDLIQVLFNYHLHNLLSTISQDQNINKKTKET